MSILALLVCILCLAINLRKKQEKLLNPAVLFFGLWTIIMLASALNLYGINAPSGEAYFLLILMFVFFFIGNYYCMYIKKRHKKTDEAENVTKKDKQFSIRKRLFWMLMIATLLFSAIDIFLIIKNYLGGVPMWQIRNWTLEPFGSNNPILSRRTFIEELIRTVVISPFGLLIPSFSAFLFFTSKNKNEKKAIIWVVLAHLLMSSLAGGGGRLGIVHYAVVFIIAFVYYNKNLSIKDLFHKYKKIIFICGFCVIGVMIFYTIMRDGVGHFIEVTYKYFALPPTLLSEWLAQIKTSPHTYGLLTFFGLHSYLFRGLNMIGLSQLVPAIYGQSFARILDAEVFINVGYGKSNAFVTPVYYFYLDGGIPFVCLASLAFGATVANVYKKAIAHQFNIRRFAIYAITIYGVLVSFMRIQTCIPSYIISIVFVYLLTRRIGGVSTHTHTHTHTVKRARRREKRGRNEK